MKIKRKTLLPLRKREFLIALPFLIFGVLFVFAESKKRIEAWEHYANTMPTVCVGYFDASNPDTPGKVVMALAKQGIYSQTQGSVSYSVTVPAAHRKKAIEILKQDSVTNGYHYSPSEALGRP